MRRTKGQPLEAEASLLPKACYFGAACAGNAPVNRAFKGHGTAMSCTDEGSLKLERFARSLRSCFTAAGQADGAEEGSRPRRHCAASFGKAPRALREEDGGQGLEAFRRPGQQAPVPAPLGKFPFCAFCIERLTGQGR